MVGVHVTRQKTLHVSSSRVLQRAALHPAFLGIDCLSVFQKWKVRYVFYAFQRMFNFMKIHIPTAKG